MPCELEKERDIVVDEKWNNYLGKKELILVQGVTASQRSDFFIVDLQAEENGMETPIQALLNEGGFGELVCCGSLLYNVGGMISLDDFFPDLLYGDYHTHVAASCLDFRSLIDDGAGAGAGAGAGLKLVSNNKNIIKWKEAPAMKCFRVSHSCVSLGGKLYALGGQRKSPEACIGEVLDPQLGYWQDLPPPPDVSCCLSVSSPVISDDKNGRLLVHLPKLHSLYAYYPSTATWDCLDPNLRRWSERATVLIDDVIYFYTQEVFHCLTAYHIPTKEWLKVDCPEFIRLSFFDAVLNLGNGVLCLCHWIPRNFCNPKPCNPKPIVTDLRFVLLRVHHTSLGLGEVLVTYDSTKLFSFQGYLQPNNFVRL